MAHLTILLLLSFFWLPTLLAIPFKDCGDGSSPVEVTSVDIIEDEIMSSFQISGSTSKSISSGQMILNVVMDMIPNIRDYDLCEYITCPVAPGAFVLPSPKMFPTHSVVPRDYRVRVNIFEDSGDNYKEIVCLTFNFPTKPIDVVSA